jgi:hypothetical protein
LAPHRQSPPTGILNDIESDLERAPELIEEESVEIPEFSPQPAMA